MPGKAIIIVNGQPTKNYLLGSLKKQGFSLINLVTPTSKTSYEDMLKHEGYYDSMVAFQNSDAETLASLKHLLQTKEYTLNEVLAIQQIDVGLADLIRDFFGQPSNGETFRKLNHDKASTLNMLNKTLQTGMVTQIFSLEELMKSISPQSLPCTVKVVSPQQTLAAYLIATPADIELTLTKLKAYVDPSVKFWLQPYQANLYRLQTTSFNKQIQTIALWHEKIFIREGEVREDVRVLINLKKSDIISQDKLSPLAQRLAETLQLSHGLGEFVLAFDKDHIMIIDYNLALPNANQIEIMERVVGYSPLSCYLVHSGLVPEASFTKKEFKNIASLTLCFNSQDELLKLGTLPTFYRYYPDKTNREALPATGALYLVHSNREMVTASHASIRNAERLSLNLQFTSHSPTRIVDFYREAALNKRTDYSSKEAHEHQSVEETEALKHLSHESQHIPRFVKPLDSNASIQDIMRYYIDIYDLYIIHGKSPGTKVTPMNTGNPAFLPFPPIVKALRKSIQENLLAYARYNMQVPETSFVEKVTQYCQEERILAPQQKLQPQNVVIGHGSTNLYYLALKSLIKNKGDIVLITRPTYGLFIDPIYTAEGEVGFIDIKEEAGWKVQPKGLHETIHFYNEKAFNSYILTTFLKSYKAFLHAQKIFELDRSAIPPMPNIEGLTQLRKFDDYITKLNAYIDQIADPLVNKDTLKFSFPPRVRAFYHMNPHNPTGAVYTKQDLEALAQVLQAHPDVYIIDDLAHWGVLYGEIEPATFSSLNTMFEKTLTLLSLSKSYCVPGLRTGVAIGNPEIIGEMQYRLLNSSSSATLPAMIALDAVFSTPKAERELYLRSNSQAYLFRRNLMGALVNGLQKTQMPFEHTIKVYQLFLECEYKEGKPFDLKLLKLILSGMPLVRTLTQPKGCFFHLLDISGLIGATIGQSAPLQTSTDVRNAIYSICAIDTVPGEISGNFFNYSLRMSFSLTPQQIYHACKNIHLFIGNYIVKHNPSLLEKDPSAKELPLKLPEAEGVDDVILNKAAIRFYLNQAIQSLNSKYVALFTLNYLQNKPRLQALEQKKTELSGLSEKLLDRNFEETIHKEMSDYFKENENWLQNHSSDFEQLKIANQSALTASINSQPLSPNSAKLLLKAAM